MSRDNAKKFGSIWSVFRIVTIFILVGLMVYGLYSITNVMPFRQNIIKSAKQMTAAKPENIEITGSF